MGWLTRTDRLIRGYLRLRGVQSRTLATLAGDVHFYDAKGWGPGPTLVMQHGYGAGNATHFFPALLRLRLHFRRILAPELPGHGFSGAPTEATFEALFAGVADVLERELDEPAVVFGNSLGGAVALAWASVRPAPEVLGNLRVPTLLLWGRSDRVMLREMFDWYRAHLPAQAIVEEPEGVGHCPHLDRPLWTMRRIVDFSRGIA